ncbi:MAG: flagellar protein FlaG [Treponema sp.]|nr:flagellar protein FlaG [Treponema sp.]
MSISISSIVPGVSFTPAPELSGIQSRSPQQRAAAEKLAASLPGNNRQASAPQEMKKVVADVQRVSQIFNKKLQFVVDQQSNEVIVKVIDKDTDKVIKVLPPEELQRLHRKLKDTIGFLFNERV